jgi:hypothetical protein
MRSPKIPDGRVHFLQRFAILMGEEGGNRPLDEREAVERKKGSVAVKNRREKHFDRPPTVYMGWFYHLEYPDICPEYPEYPAPPKSEKDFNEG